MSERDTERMRAHFAERMRRDDDAPVCPAAEEIWAAARGESTARRNRELLNHSLGCPACADAFRLARELDAELPAEHRQTGRPGSTRVRWWGAGLAAAVLLAVFVIPRLPREESVPVFRDDGRLVIESLVPEEQPLPRDDAWLRWTAGPDGSLYDVEVTDERIEPLYERRDLETHELRIPVEQLVSVESGGKLLWRVEVVLPDGSRISSRTFVHRIE